MGAYKECSICIATPWCKRYSGEVEVPKSSTWCRAKFILEKALKLANVPPEFMEANIYNYQEDDENRKVLAKLKPYVENIVEVVDNGKNFFFYHPSSGTGKTYHGFMLLNQYIYKTCLTDRFDFEKPLALYVPYADLMDDLRYRRELEEVQEKVELIRNVPLLLLDDIGSGTSSSFTIEQTNLILNHRFNHRLSTIVTSNFSPKELAKEEIIGYRSVSRMLKDSVGIRVGGRDRRMDSIKGVKG